MNLIDRITGAKPENTLASLFDQRDEAIRKLQASADQLAKDLDAVVDLTDEIWKQMPARPLSTPVTFSSNLFARLSLYLWGATNGRIGRGGINPFTARQQKDIVLAAGQDRELMESIIAKAQANQEAA